MGGLTAAQILELASQCCELQRLQLTSSRSIRLAAKVTDSWLEKVVRCCPQLNCLDLGKESESWKLLILKPAVLKATCQRPHLQILF